MKEELIRVLKNKLDDVNKNIDSLVDLNEKIESEEDNLAYASKIIDIFGQDGNYDIMNFAKLAKEDFDQVLTVLSNDAEKIFSTGSCNYDGLVYLINGINSGVSLTLTEEQKSGIEYFIRGIVDKKEEYKASIDGYNLVKTRYPINDVNKLNEIKDEYDELLEDLDKEKYVAETDLILDAIKFGELTDEKTIDLLTYVLEYNADIYKNHKDTFVKEEVKVEEPEVEIPMEDVPVDEFKEDSISFEDIPVDIPSVEVPSAVEIPPVEESFEEPKVEEVETNIDVLPPVAEEVHPSDEVMEINPTDIHVDTPVEYTSPVVEESVSELPVEEPAVVTPEEPKVEEVAPTTVDNDFKDVINEKADYEEFGTNSLAEEKTSTRELQRLFNKYNIKEQNISLNELVVGNVNNYKEILDVLKDNNMIETFENSNELFVETLLYSNGEVIKDVLKYISEDLSVDNEDYLITRRIAVDTIPSIFVKDGGNYDNFVKNIETFKEIGLNLINLFDFSKEIFIANHNNIINNLNIVRSYNLPIDFKNAKYLLLIPNIGERLDYYVESVYVDKTRNETFDGVEYIKNYAPKLNVVTMDTIKRLRFASESGKKVFGNKPLSLSGEITNLKVNVLEMNGDYSSKFFNNEFEGMTPDEVREYTKLIRNSSNVGNYADELQFLDTFKNGLRYVIEGVNVSVNKVLRNYNILRSYGIANRKALEFAVCYNLVIMKEEYQKLKAKLEELGGNL